VVCCIVNFIFILAPPQSVDNTDIIQNLTSRNTNIIESGTSISTYRTKQITTKLCPKARKLCAEAKKLQGKVNVTKEKLILKRK
jgi:hypothetical protein